MKEVVSELSLKEIYPLVIHQKPIGAKLEVNLSFLHFTSTSATPCSFPCFPSRSSNPNSTQYYLISPKTCPCHTHITLGPVHQIFYLGRSSPKSASQNQVCVCEEYNDTSYLACVLEFICVLITVIP